MHCEFVAVIRLDRVSKRYAEGAEALSEVSLEIENGEMVFLTGHSGAGKSTLLKLIILMERPTQGQLFVDGRNLGQARVSEIPALRRQIGVVLQNPHLLPDRSVHENVALPLLVADQPVRSVDRRVRAALDLVGLEPLAQRMPVSLSAGEQQRVSIARAVVNRPRILLADEPTGNLDAELSTEIMQQFMHLNAAEVTVVIATHDVLLIKQFPRRNVLLRNGQVERDQPATTP